jgi:hypothetical protein
MLITRAWLSDLPYEVTAFESRLRAIVLPLVPAIRGLDDFAGNPALENF